MHLSAQKRSLELVTCSLIILIGGIGAAKPESSTHWAFQPLANPAVPPTKIKKWTHNNIDHFILKKIEAAGLVPSKKADRRTLIRRLYYTLTGLPPTFAEISAFEKNPDRDAYEVLVDRLLSSSHFGERWGRHWLDIARYSDTKGYVFEESRDYPYAYTYRDWVIRAFNDDLPYDRFLSYQIAADSLTPQGISTKHLAAMGFLTVGRRFLNREPDIIDDRIDVTFRGMMGLTVACARCHDHKYDPIPISDYYSLYGVFASSKEPGELPLLENQPDTKQARAFKNTISKKQKQIDDYLEKRSSEQRQPNYIKKYLLAATEGRNLKVEELKKLASTRKLLQQITIRWRDTLKSKSTSRDPVYAPWLAFAALPTGLFSKQAAQTWQQLKSGDAQLNASLVAEFDKLTPDSLEQVASIYARILANGKHDSELSSALDHCKVAAGSIYPLLETTGQQHVRKLRRELEGIKTDHPGAPPRAMAMIDLPSPREPRIFERGDPGRRGAQVPRQFLELIKGADRKPFSKGSGRLEMAQEIISKDNPLTARVWVNRVWGHVLGKHLVSTPSDFGLRSDRPSHPELLDHLAVNFIADNWSTKKLIRSILLSATYQQAVAVNPDDPENLHYTHATRRRLDFESMRDSMLAVSGQLDRKQFGKPVQIHTVNYSRRRTIYGHIERQNLPPVFRTFDFASPDVHVAKRPHTVVPQQALYMLNGQFVYDQAIALMNLPGMTALKSQEARVNFLYQKVLSRNPDNKELEEAIGFLNPVTMGGSWEFGFGHREKVGGQVKFTPFPHLAEKSWQVSPILPHPTLGWASLNRKGGHPGSGQTHAILRWRAPADGKYDISSRISLPSPSSDGIVLSLTTEPGKFRQSWTISPGNRVVAKAEPTELKKGETVFFIVAPGNTDAYDSFIWSPEIRDINTGENWHASTGFDEALITSPDSLFQQYAQALLAANEFVFLD